MAIIVQVQIGDSQIHPVTTARNVSALLDNTFSMTAHVSSICSRTHRCLRNICQVRHLLDQRSTAVFIHASLTSRLDFSHALLPGLPANLFKGLPRVQDAAPDACLGLVAERT